MPELPRIVLDTNVWLDLLVFDDPLGSHLLHALRQGRLQAVTRADCRAEWRRVLHYPGLPVDDHNRPGFEAAYDALAHELVRAVPDEGARLPRCADPDDQMFLELARDSGARWLVSKDKELLRLDRRAQTAAGFSILRPQQWSAAALAAD